MMELVNSKVVRVPVTGSAPVIARRGAMLGYTGMVAFSPVSSGGSMPGMVGRALAGESVAMMVSEGNGEVFYGFAGMHLSVIEVTAERSLTVEASRLLLHDASLQSAVVPVAASGGGGGGGLGGMLRGAARSMATGQGLATTVLSGHGHAVLLSHGGTTEIPTDSGVTVDPQAYVGHSGRVNVDLRTALSWRDAVGRGSGEGLQLKLSGSGIVYVQASERKV